MIKQATGSPFRVRFAEMYVASQCSSNRNLGFVLKASLRGLGWARRVVLFGAAILFAGAIGAVAQAPILQPGWNQLSPVTSPPQRYITALTYDATHNQAVLFGGFGESGFINDTWLWNGMTWTNANPANSPSPRAGSAMAYDAASGNVVLFGGLASASSRLGDTWLWDGTNWTQANPATVPPARASGTMVYDAALGEIVMFGGVSAAGFDMNDTWVWNGTNWTQLVTAHSPSARDEFGMVYDAARSQVVLFGGSSNGSYVGDTWVFNGTDWTQLSPGTNPPAREASAMAYDAALGETVMWGGYNGAYLSDTWVWNGSSWTQQTTATSPAGRYADNGMTFDAAQGQLIFFGGLDSSQQFSDTWEFGLPQNFGSINVCPSGQTSPAPCSNTLTLTYNLAATATFNPTQVVTQGISNLDFTLASGSTCTGTVSGSTCTVNVKFAPLAPGLRMGAVQLYDSGSNLLVTTPIYGIGQGPAVAFSPGTQTTVNTTASYPLNQPKGVAVDAAGDVFIADNANTRVVEVAANGTATTVGSGLEYPQGLAVDGAGDLFIADNNRNQVVEVPAGCTSSACQIVLGSNLRSQLGVAVDGAGDVFFGDFLDGEVAEIPANGGPQTVVYSPGAGSNPVGLAVDAAGDLFVADYGLKKVVEIPAGCTNSSCQSSVGTGWDFPEAVAVDAAGDVFVADEAPKVVEVPAGCTSSACQITISGILAYGVAVDAKGDVFLPDLTTGNSVVVINGSQAPSLSFPTATNVGSSDTIDGAMAVTLQNVGNATLSFPVPLSGNNPSIGPDFSLFSNGQGDCPLTTSSSSFPSTLAAGALCVYSVTFDPITPGSLNESLVLTDNNLNAISTSPAATQTIALSGTGVGTNYTLTVSTAGTGSGSIGGTNCSTGSYPSGTIVTCTEIPSGGSQFTGWSGTTCSGLGSCSFSLSSTSTVVANFALNYALTVTEVGTGSGTVTDSLGQISCSEANGVLTGTCSGNYSTGMSVTLTANASGTSTFVGWGGACASTGASASCNLMINSAQNVSASFVAAPATQPGMLKPITAGVVYGQGGSFTTNTANNGGVSASSLNALGGVVADASGNLYVADGLNNRVLFYPAGSTTPTRVYGQGGSFTTNSPNNGGISANSLSDPQGLALDSGGNLYVADESNNRVLFYPAGSTTATRVYGQGGSFTANTWNNGGVSANSLGEPYGLAVDSAGDLYVGDYQNNRVLFYPSGSTTATQVYGQGGSFTSNTVNNGGVSTNSLDQPTGVALDSSGDLYVADIYNNRVLFYPYNSTTATQVYGQGGSFTSNTANNGGVSASSLNNPMYVALDSSGDLYVVDRSNNRALFYPFGSTTATRVYGQGGSFTATTANNGGVSANSLSQPWAVALDKSGNLYVSDYSNNRVLEYGSFGNVNVCPSGQPTPAPCNNTVTLSYHAAASTSFGATQVVTQGATGLDFSLGSGSTCTGTVAAGNSCTVNVNFTPLAPGLRTGAVNLFDNSGNPIATTQISGVGQGPEIAFSPGVQTSVGSGLGLPYQSVVDTAGDVFIADSQNNKVVKITPGGVQTAVSATGLSGPSSIAVDGAGDVFIADSYNSRIVEVTPLGIQTTVPTTGLSYLNGMALDGLGDIFVGDSTHNRVVEITSSGMQTTVGTGLNYPSGVAVDGAGDVFIADSGNSRVVEVTPGGVQTTVTTSGLHIDYGVAVDGAGDVFIADSGNNRVVEVTPSGVQTTVLGGLNNPLNVAVDEAGNIFIDNTYSGQVLKLQRSLPPSLSFALTNVGSTSTDSPQSFSVQNVGNQLLTGSVAFSLGSNFVQNAGPSCGGGFSLALGATCSESFSFAPQSTGAFTGAANFSDNTLNLSPLVVLQAVNLSGTGGLNGQAVATVVPNVVGMSQAAATTAITGAGLTLGAVSSGYSNSEPAGTVMGESPAAGTQANPGSAVAVRLSIGEAPTPSPNPLTFENNYLITGDYAAAGVTLRGTPVVGGMASGTITIPASSGPGSQGVPTGADIVDGFLYWEALENTLTPSATTGTFLGYSITGQQIGSDLPYTDSVTHQSGTLRVYRADVNNYFQDGTSGIRVGSGAFPIALPSSSGSGFPITEGASLVVIYRVLSPNFPLKAVAIYDGSAIPASSTTQNVQGFYDAQVVAGNPAEVAALNYADGSWSGNPGSITLSADASSYTAQLNAGGAYAAVILSTPVTNSDNDGILNAWKTGPPSGDFFFGQPGYYDVKTNSWVPLPGAKHGEKDLFVQLDYMCGNVLAIGACDPTQENLFPSPDPDGNDPLVMVQQAFAQTGIVLHLQIGNAVAESTCTDSPGQLCQFPSEPGVIGWKNSLEFSKLWPRNFESCAAGGDCTARFPYGQKDSYHYVLFGHSLAIPAWNSRYGTLTSISVAANGTTTIVTPDRGTGINACPSRFTISGVLGYPSLNGVYNTSSCPDTKTIILATPGLTTAWSYPNSTLPEPVIGLTSGTVTSISGYSDLGGADSAVTLALWETAPNQDMSKRANVVAGTLFHEIGHTIGLSHGGLYYDTPGSYIPTFEANCKPNYQSIMNYLFQLDGVGPNAAVAFSNQTLTELYPGSLGSVIRLADTDTGFVGNAATFATSAWYGSTAPSPTASPATFHCDGTPLTGDTGYRVNGPIAPITPSWSNGQNITFDGQSYTQLRGFNDFANIDLRQVGATGGEFASLSNVLSFGSSETPLNIAAGGNVTLGAGGTVALGAGGNVTLGAGGNVTLGSAGMVTLGSGGSVTLNNGGTVALSAAGTITFARGGNVTLGAGGNVTLGGGGTIALGAGGNVTLGGGGTVTLPSGGTIALNGGGSVTIPSTGGTYTIPGTGGTVTLGGGGNVTLGGGGNVTLGGGGTIALGAGGNVTLGGGGNVTLGGGGTITLGGGGNVTLGAGGNVTLGGGGTVTLGAGGNVTLGGGGNVTLGAGGNVTLGAGGNVTLGAGGNVTLGAGGTVTLGAGGNVTLGAGGNITLGAGGSVTLSSGGTITSGGTTQTVPAGTYTVSAGGNITLGAGGNVTLGGGGTVTLGAGGNVTLGGGGNVTLGAGGNITLGAGGNITLGGGGNITLGGGGVSTNELTYDTANSIVRPPPSATYTQTSSGITINWTAPAFGVVQSYAISRSVITPPSTTPGPTVVIGTVTGTNGNPPATTFTDTTPPGGTLIYTIITTLVPDSGTSTQRQSLPSPPAVLTLNQTIVLGSLPPSALLSSGSLTVTATAESNGIHNGQLVSFNVTGQCSVGSPSINTANGVSSATVTLNDTGTCTITASQAGFTTTQSGGTSYNAAQAVSATFAIVAQNSGTTPQIITFPQLPNVHYGNTFALNASSNFGQQITYSTTGPCNPNGTTSGVGLCSITASAPGGTGPNNSTYNAVSVSQSFNIIPAVLSVTATSLTSPYGQIPALANDYKVTGFVNNDLPTVVTGTPVLSTTATPTSTPAIYPITVSNGTLAAVNYTFSPVNGTLTIQAATATISINNVPSSPIYGGTFTPTYAYSGTGTPTESTTSTTTSVCKVSAGVVSFVGVGPCTLTASATATTDDSAATGNPQTFTVGQTTQTITFAQPGSPVIYGVAPIALSATGSGSGIGLVFTIDASSTGKGTITGSTLTVTGAGNLVIDANEPANADYKAAPRVQRAIQVNKAVLTVTANNVSRAYGLANPTLTASYAVFVNGDSFATAVTGSPSLTTTAVATSLPGSYPITASMGTLAAANYTFNFVNGTLTVTFTGSVPPSGTSCNGAYSGTFAGNLTVTNGQNCIFVGGGASGNITETGGNLALSNATIGGNLTVSSGGTFSIGPSTTIKGNVTIQSIPKGSATNQVCGSTIDGNLVFQTNGTAVLIGSGSPSCAGNIIQGSLQVVNNTAAITIDGNTISGSLQVQSNTAAVTMDTNKVSGSVQVQSNSGATTIDGNTVGGSLQDQSNTGATQVVSNVIKAALQCQSNTSITGSGNTAASKTSQCATF